ncbi:hypothetical protein Anas_00331 [Armadillidium nasatum]|uniref:Uncharacterized protein n=1 Tax=Armadillidium nasatum TaxID=96803 RepID=A0A5N5TG66_9CRUS|nr:hypothetical protein Anas_00331 [Armadillidium nasatum]
MAKLHSMVFLLVLTAMAVHSLRFSKESIIEFEKHVIGNSEENMIEPESVNFSEDSDRVKGFGDGINPKCLKLYRECKKNCKYFSCTVCYSDLIGCSLAEAVNDLTTPEPVTEATTEEMDGSGM